MKACVVFVLLLGPSASQLSARQLPLRPGDRVRITAATAQGRYEVRQVGTTGLTVADSTGSVLDVPLSSVERLHVSRGQRTAWGGAKRGGGIGFAIGLGAGVLLGLAEGDDPPGALIRFTAAEKALGYGIVFGGGAGIIGAFIGASAPGERWERVPLNEFAKADGPRIQLARDGGFAIAYVAPF